MALKIEKPVEMQAKMKLTNFVNFPRSSCSLCDSGADSYIVGRIAKIETVTNRSANLVGYDPQITRSFSLPIVTVLIKTMFPENVLFYFKFVKQYITRIAISHFSQSTNQETMKLL